MQFTVETVIEASREAVWKAFDNPSNLKRWQPTLQSFEAVSGAPGLPGAVSRLIYKEHGREIVLTETISLRREPEEFAGEYDSGTAANAVHNRFEPLGSGRTRWTMNASFRFRGGWRFFTWLFRGAIAKRLREDCDRFKALAEGRL
jgi:hypothetical protein